MRKHLAALYAAVTSRASLEVVSAAAFVLAVLALLPKMFYG